MISGAGRLRPFGPSPPPSANISCRNDVTRKALLIGVSYTLEEFASGKEDQMEGTHTDVDKFRDLLIGTMYFDKGDIVVMTDALKTPRDLWPTKVNIEREIHRFVQGASPGDIHFIFYGGHGHQKPNFDSTEADKKDEHIVPCDAVGPKGFIEDKMIIDDVLKEILVMPLAAAGSKLTAVFDCCHSGTVLDLCHYRCNDCTSWTKTVRHLYRYIVSDAAVNLGLLGPRAVNKLITASHLDPYIKDCKGFCLVRKRKGQGYVVCISACRDEEIAWGGKKGGSLTRAIMSAMEANPEPTLEELNVSIDATVKVYAKSVEQRRKKEEQNLPKIVQHPQFSSLWPLDMKQRFLR
ncbi:caspase domain-containing protein [Desarmillaria tabescens]|uniref:Caspase domain-containing protein n=1 Tax=Armillaria tabescens TaxID=1929756 RepID=A0AA39KA72_ARMTA|nr:caspase domain-containing protein [Desarmillaria tabescens]KAK0457424.1 caspase domain-containing protein [Desarmillaria tabescens]